MNKKLSNRLHSFPKDYELSNEAKAKIEQALQAELNRLPNERKWLNFHKLQKKLMVPISVAVGIAIIVILFVSSENFYLFQTTNHNPDRIAVDQQVLLSDEEYKEMTELAKNWANSLKTRDGTQRFGMMTAKAKEKFIQEQKIRNGEDWNYIIGDSSPWVVDYMIEINGLQATITYKTETSEPNVYKTQEVLTFIKEDNALLVDDYQTIFENIPFE